MRRGWRALEQHSALSWHKPKLLVPCLLGASLVLAWWSIWKPAHVPVFTQQVQELSSAYTPIVKFQAILL